MNKIGIQNWAKELYQIYMLAAFKEKDAKFEELSEEMKAGWIAVTEEAWRTAENCRTPRSSLDF